jgi:hypothetical protein
MSLADAARSELAAHPGAPGWARHALEAIAHQADALELEFERVLLQLRGVYDGEEAGED